MSLHPEYESVFRALETAGIRWCCLRDELDGGVLGGDLDLLTAEEDFERSLEVLRGLGYRVKTRERMIPLKTGLVKFAGGEFVYIDLHRRVVQDGIVFIDGKGFLDRRRSRPGYYLPSDADLLVLLIVHNVIGKGTIQAKHQEPIIRLAHEVDRDALDTILAGRTAREPILSILERIDEHAANPGTLASVAPELRRRLLRDDPGARRRLRRRGLARFARRFSLRTHAPLYALLGVDGVGKSSLNEALLSTLRKGGFPAESLYMGPWGHYRLGFVGGTVYKPGWSLSTREWLRGVFGRSEGPRPRLREVWQVLRGTAHGEKFEGDRLELHRVVRERSRIFLTIRYARSVLSSIRFLTTLMLEMYYRYYRAYRLRRRGRIVITDRYIYDLMTGRMHELIPNCRRVRSFLCQIFFRPTRTFLLKNDPATILSRKRDLDADTLHQFMELYEGLASKHGFETVWTDETPERIAHRMIEGRFDQIVAMTRS